MSEVPLYGMPLAQMTWKGHDLFQCKSHLQTLTIYKLGVDQNYYTFSLTLLTNIVLCSKIPSTWFIRQKCFDKKSDNKIRVRFKLSTSSRLSVTLMPAKKNSTPVPSRNVSPPTENLKCVLL
jgi:hypothetical protein